MVRFAGFFFVFALGSANVFAQVQDPAGPAIDLPADTASVAAETPISAKQLGKNMLSDQKAVWTFPWQVAKGKHWKPATAVAIGTAGFIILDPHIAPYFRNNSRFDSYATGPLRGRNTTLAITLTPAVFYIVGLATHSTHAKNTGILAVEGLIGTQATSFVLKNAIGRLTPADIPAHGNFRDTWFKYRGSFTNRGGFPSGHTASAFAVATVIAGRYPKHRWVPYLAYGAASFLSLTRLPTRAHFPSDIFIGAAMGYGIGRLTLSRQQ